MKTKDAVKHLQEQLIEDLELRNAYKSTIAVCFYDAFVFYKKKNQIKNISGSDVAEIGNIAAERFLELFCDEVKVPDGR